MTNSEGVAFLRVDVERFCGEPVDLAPAVRLRLVTELRATLDEVTTAAFTGVSRPRRWAPTWTTRSRPSAPATAPTR